VTRSDDAGEHPGDAAEAGLTPVWDRFVPEGDGGHGLVLASAS
jgi:hypothetical protein